MLVTMLGDDYRLSTVYKDEYVDGWLADRWQDVRRIGTSIGEIFVPPSPEDPAVTKARLEAGTAQARMQTVTVLGLSAIALTGVVVLTRQAQRRRRRYRR